MAGEIATGLLSSILGGAFVAGTTYLTTRKRTSAETRKLDAEADRTRAETTKLLLEVSMLRAPNPSDFDPPMGWQVRESAPHSYEVGVDDRTRSEGTRSGYIRSRPHASGFGTLMQTIKADVYLGQRLRLTGRVKTNRVEGWVGLWMRVDAPNGDVLGFDNMNDRRIQGTTGWTAYDVVLDVPSSATSIAFGVLLDGPGQTWLDDVVLTVVTDAVPTTALPADIDDPPARAVNLDFEA